MLLPVIITPEGRVKTNRILQHSNSVAIHWVAPTTTTPGETMKKVHEFPLNFCRMNE
jgi:hypothetical protein